MVVDQQRIQVRFTPSDMAVLRRLGEMSGVSADLVAKRVFETVLPELRRVIEAAEELRTQHDPAGRGYIVWSIAFPDDALSEEGPTLQPSGGVAVLHVSDETHVSANVVEVGQPVRNSCQDLFMPAATADHLNIIPTSRVVPAGVS